MLFIHISQQRVVAPLRWCDTERKVFLYESLCACLTPQASHGWGDLEEQLADLDIPGDQSRTRIDACKSLSYAMVVRVSASFCCALHFLILSNTACM